MQKAPVQSLRRRLPGSHRLRESLHSQQARHSSHRSRGEDGSLPTSTPHSAHPAPRPDGMQCRQRQPSRASCHRSPSETSRCNTWRTLSRSHRRHRHPGPHSLHRRHNLHHCSRHLPFRCGSRGRQSHCRRGRPCRDKETRSGRCTVVLVPTSLRHAMYCTRVDRAKLKDGIGGCKQWLTPHLRLPPPPPPKPPPREASEDSQPGSSCFVSCACPSAECC